MKKDVFMLLDLLISALILVASFDGRYIRFEHLFPEFNGKPVISISSTLQNREGFIWFGTDMGLARYDGYNFTFFYPPSKQKQSSPFAVAHPIFEDNSDGIWKGE